MSSAISRIAILCLIALLSPAALTSAEEPDALLEPTYRIERDIVYARPDGYRLRADMFIPKQPGPRPAMLLIHGGGWMGGSKVQMRWHAKRLAAHGYVVMSINYRLAPKFKYPAQLDDCKAAFAWLCDQAHQFEIDTQRIGVLGYSAGAHLACLMNVTGSPADDCRVCAVVAGGAPCDFSIFPPDNMFLAYWLEGSGVERPDNYRKASPVFFATADDAPTFFYHGAADKIVPAFSSQSLQSRFEDVEVVTQMHLCQQKGHVRAFMDHQAFQESLAFLDRYLQPLPPPGERQD